MSYLTLKIENSDILFNKDNQLQLTEIDDIAQNYKIFLETQYESDFRDPTYGFKLNELLTLNLTNKEETLKLFVIEALLLHPRTKTVDSVEILNIENGKYYVQVYITLLSEQEIIIEVEYTIE